jgi:hypothetical protein
MNKNKIRYNKELLQECLLRDNAKLEEEYDNLNRNNIIKFTCRCGKGECCKKLYYIYLNGGAFCKACLNKNKNIKTKNTNIEIYGVDNPMKNEKVKETLKDTINKLYGVDNCFKSEHFKQKIKNTNMEKYGVESSSQNEQVKQKIKNTNIEKYGYSSPMKNESIKEKHKESILKNTGYTHALKNPLSKQKSKNTMIERYGVEHASHKQEFRQKAKNTMLERYGVENSFQNKDIVKKMRSTMLERYGVEYNLQIPEVSEKQLKNSYKRKEVITPSGKIINMQGYEPYAYKILLETYTEEEILNSRTDVPEIWWNDKEGKSHRYFVDFYIPRDNLMIEVKSERTLITGKEKIEKTLEASREAGYNIEIWIINNKGDIINKF